MRADEFIPWQNKTTFFSCLKILRADVYSSLETIHLVSFIWGSPSESFHFAFTFIELAPAFGRAQDSDLPSLRPDPRLCGRGCPKQGSLRRDRATRRGTWEFRIYTLEACGRHIYIYIYIYIPRVSVTSRKRGHDPLILGNDSLF